MSARAGEDGACGAICRLDDEAAREGREAARAPWEGEGPTTFPLVDTHCHLDFAGNSEELAAVLSRCGGAFSGTCDPRDFERTQRALADFAPQVRVGLGLHPWWVADGTCGPEEVSLFERLAPRAELVSEVGLDFQPRREPTREVQIEAFTRVCRAAAKPLAAAVVGAFADATAAGRAAAHPVPKKRVMSIHSSKAAACALDILERTGCLDACTCIFHWFSGSQDELSRAIDADCLFSVNERMLETKRGRAYARAIPEGRLLLETDAPPKPVARFSPETHMAQLSRTIGLLAEARGADTAALAERIATTSRALFS